MGWRKALRAGAAASLVALLVGWFPSVAGAQAKVAFTISDKRITEASGMARDTGAEVLWTVNDSGDSGVVYGLGTNGKVRGTLNYRATPQDVEAVAVRGNRLYVADIGDNDEKRDVVTVYYFDNPRASGLTVSYKSWDFRYPDGPHDAETLLVTPAGRVSIVTKGAEGGVYQAPENPSRQGTNELVKVGDAPALVTDGVVLPGGKQIALLTYTRVIVVDAKTGDEEGSTSLDDPQQGGPKQAESMALSLDGESLLVGSEGEGSKVYTVPIPDAAGTASSSASPSPSATPADSGADGDPDDSGASAPAQRGTLLAVGIAGLVAVVAGAVVGLVRKA